MFSFRNRLVLRFRVESSQNNERALSVNYKYGRQLQLAFCMPGTCAFFGGLKPYCGCANDYFRISLLTSQLICPQFVRFLFSLSISLLGGS